MSGYRVFLLPAFLIVISFQFSAEAAPTKAQTEELREVWNALVEAGNLYKTGKGADAAKLVEQAQARYDKFDAPADEQTQALLDRIYKALQGAHGAMQLDGIRLPELNRRVLEPAPKPQPTDPQPQPEPPQPEPEPAADMVSFSKHVAPMLLSKCGRCHVNDDKGGFNFSTFAGLARGSSAGQVVFPGDPVGSPLVEVIVEGDMPRGGGKVSAEELTALKLWIAQGAKYDGPALDTPLARLAGDAAMPDAPMEAPKVEMVKAGAEGPSFGRDVAAVVAKNCTGCHGTNNPRGNFSLATFDRMLRGGDSGPQAFPAKPHDSLLIKKLRGQAGAQMPLNQPPLPEETIAAIAAWIAAGAKFDGPSTTAPVERVAAFVKAATSTHEELSAERQKIAGANWKLALPGIDSHTSSSENFHMVGNVNEETLTDLSKLAEEIAPQVAKVFGADETEPLVKGRMTLFVFPQRYDYSEFGQMVEKRKLPPQWYGHWNYDGIDAYGAFVPSRTDKYSPDALIAQQLAGVYVASHGTPRWFAEGAARVVASRLADDDPRVQSWDESLPSTFAQMRAADDFLTGKLNEEDSMLASYSFVKFLMKDSRKFGRLLKGLQSGGDFEQTFASVYGGPPAALTPAWAATAARGR